MACTKTNFAGPGYDSRRPAGLVH